MRPEDIGEVRELDLFSRCSEATFEELMRPAFLQRFPAGVELIRESDPADFLYVVVEGTVEMFAEHAGRETTLAIILPLGLFILAAVLTDAPYLQSARTLERSRILMIPASAVREAMAADAAFSAAIVQELAAGYRDLVRHVKDQKLRPGVERLANWLLHAHDVQGCNGRVEIAIEKRLLASLLGMTPENLSRAFRTLRPYGVCVDGAVVTIVDRDDLARLAKPSRFIDDPTI